MQELRKTFRIVSKIYIGFVLVGCVHWSFVLSASGRKGSSEKWHAKLDLNDVTKFRISQDEDFAS